VGGGTKTNPKGRKNRSFWTPKEGDFPEGQHRATKTAKDQAGTDMRRDIFGGERTRPNHNAKSKGGKVQPSVSIKKDQRVSREAWGR